jgi:alpha-L-rhamnosidase
VLAFPKAPDQVVPDVKSVIDLTGKMDREGRLTWDAPTGEWVIQRFMMANTGQRLMVPSPNSSGLMLDHMDAKAAEKHFQYIMDRILTMRPSPDALRYMEVDSVEVHDHTDWTDSFVQEFRQRRGYDPIPYLPALKGKTFSDPNIAPRFLHDYRMTVSDLWIDGHYIAGKNFLNRYGIKLVAESGHGGYPRTDPIRSMGVVDIPRGEFWNGLRLRRHRLGSHPTQTGIQGRLPRAATRRELSTHRPARTRGHALARAGETRKTRARRCHVAGPETIARRHPN